MIFQVTSTGAACCTLRDLSEPVLGRDSTIAVVLLTSLLRYILEAAFCRDPSDLERELRGAWPRQVADLCTCSTSGCVLQQQGRQNRLPSYIHPRWCSATLHPVGVASASADPLRSL